MDEGVGDQRQWLGDVGERYLAERQAADLVGNQTKRGCKGKLVHAQIAVLHQQKHSHIEHYQRTGHKLEPDDGQRRVVMQRQKHVSGPRSASRRASTIHRRHGAH